jgi:hypothetical protein
VRLLFSSRSGKTCEIEADICQVLRPCQNGGTCVGTFNAYKCNCPMGFGSTNCDQSDVSSFIQRVSDEKLSETIIRIAELILE